VADQQQIEAVVPTEQRQRLALLAAVVLFI
jgi:hypothetical protein